MRLASAKRIRNQKLVTARAAIHHARIGNCIQCRYLSDERRSIERKLERLAQSRWSATAFVGNLPRRWRNKVRPRAVPKGCIFFAFR
jgi:hypothetical protein